MNNDKRIKKYRKKPENPNPLLFLRLICHPCDIRRTCEHNKPQERKKSVRPAVKQSDKQKSGGDE